MSRQVKLVHAVPILLLLICIGSMYLLAGKLAHEIATAQLSSDKIAHDALNPNGMPILDVDEPPMPEMLSLPHSFDEARDLSLRLSTHLSTHPSSRLYLVLLFASIYLLKQTFSIPGSVLLNVMAGFIFGPVIGVPLVAFLTASGASGCYWLSRLIGAELIASCASLRKRMDSMATLIAHEKAHGNLFLYLLIIRVFPFTPNWFVNLAAPLVGVPFHLFFSSCICGLLPYVYITVTAGDTLHTFTRMQQSSQDGTMPKMTLSDVMDTWTLVKLALLAVSLLLPTLLKRYVLKSNSNDSKEAQFKL